MRQLNNHGLSFAVSLDEQPHSSQCRLILPRGAMCNEEPRWCQGYIAALRSDEFCAQHLLMPLLEAEPELHVQCAVGVHAWDMEYKRCRRCPATADSLAEEVCCELSEETGHHEPDCPSFFPSGR